jgi:dephospho-CoA kinase
MIKVGLSGNRYSGKTEISKMFKQIGIPVFDADIVLKFIIGHSLETNRIIKEKIGEHIFKNGDIDPKFVTDSDFMEMLYYATFELINAYHAFNVKNKQSIYSIFHSSFLFETNWVDSMDYNINVFCPKLERMERCKEITKMKVSNIAYMLRNEIDDLDKNKKSAYIIHNYKGTDPLSQVNKIDQNIIDIYLKNSQLTTSEQTLNFDTWWKSLENTTKGNSITDISDIILTHY